MSPDDDIRTGLGRAADAVAVPGGAVGKVRDAVRRRRHRRTAVRAGSVSAGAAGVVVAALVLGQGQVWPDAAPPAGPPAPDSVTSTDDGPLLRPDGLERLRLGSPVEALGEVAGAPADGGCQAVETVDGRFLSSLVLDEPAASATEVLAWARDGEVVSIALVAAQGRVTVAGDTPRTWLGPSLRSPLAQALELPGARLVVDDPRGDDGPGVSNVVVPAGDGVELVLADPPVRGGPAAGRITALVLRTEAGRDCRAVDRFGVPGQGLPDGTDVAMSPEGVAGVPLGGSVAAAVAAGAVVPVEAELVVEPLGGRGCSRFRTPDGVDVWADGDRVVAVSSTDGGPRFVLAAPTPVRSGQVMAELEAVPGAVPVTAPAPATDSLDLPVAPGVRARVTGFPEPLVAETTGFVVPGAPSVDGIVVYTGDEQASSLCGG